MKRLILFTLFGGLLASQNAQAAFALVVSTAKGSATGTGVTTNAIDTTGSTLLVVAFMNYALVSGGIVTDNKGNTWLPLTSYQSSAVRLRLFYCIAPTVGAGHTFTGTSNTGPDYTSIAVMGFSGTTPVFDLQSGAASTLANTIQPGSITPRWTAEVLITATAGAVAAATASVDSSFTGTVGVSPDGADHFGIYMAYIIETSIVAKNPTWTWTGAPTVPVAVMATFKYSGSSPGGTSVVRRRAYGQ